MKKLFAALALLVVLLLASYYVIGTRVQPILQESIDKALANSPQLTITPKSSSSGLFSSKYVYTIAFTPPAEAGKPQPTKLLMGDITCNVTHGPIPVAAGSLKPSLALIDTTFALAPSADKELQDFLTRFPELGQTKLLTWVNLDSSLNTRFTVPPFDRTVTSEKGAPTRIAFMGLSGDIATSASLEQATGKLNSPGLTIEDAEASAALTDLGIDFNSRQIRPALAVGTSRFQVKSMDITPKGKPSTSIKDLTAEVAATPRENMLDYMVTLSTRFNGPKSNFVPARLNFALRNLDIDALDRLLVMIRDAQKAPSTPAMEQQFKEAAQSLLPRNPSVSLDLTALEGTSQITLHADAHTEGMTQLPPIPLMALPQIRAKANFSAQEQSLIDLLCHLAQAENGVSKEDCPQTLSEGIQNMLAQGLARREGDKLLSDASWDGQGLTVNGKRLQ